jgi:hypothetical protein
MSLHITDMGSWPSPFTRIFGLRWSLPKAGRWRKSPNEFSAGPSGSRSSYVSSSGGTRCRRLGGSSRASPTYISDGSIGSGSRAGQGGIRRVWSTRGESTG